MRKIVFSLSLLTVTTMTVYSQKNMIGCSTDESKLYGNRADTVEMKKTRGLADQFYLWDVGKELHVKFFGGSPQLRERIYNIAKEWEQFANIKFLWVNDNDPSHIRVNLDDKGGHNSVIGINNLSVPQSEKTMNLDTSKFFTYDNMHGTVLHEFGHAIGLLHEHYSPLAGIKWNRTAVVDELKRTQGWDEPTIEANLFQTVALSYTNGSEYDRKSIMHYPVFARWTTDGFNVDWNNYLSEADKRFIATLYPMSGVRSNEVPRMSITDFTTMEVVRNNEKGGISLFPSFNINTAGATGKVYFTVFFYDKDGKVLKDSDDNYNLSNMVATFRAFTLKPDVKLSANKIEARDFELFIPNTEIPVPSGTELQVVFSPFLFHDGEIKWLYSSKPMTFNFIK